MEEPKSTFHEDLLLFLQEDLAQKKSEEGWDDVFDPEVREYSNILSQAVRTSAPMPLSLIIDKYQHLFGERGLIHLEQNIMEAFPAGDMQRLSFPPLRIYRGLPRTYRSNQPAYSRLQPNFSHLPSLLRLAAKKPLFSLYAFVAPKTAAVAILTRVIPGGLGDYYASIHAARQIKKAFPDLSLRVILFSEMLPHDGEAFAVEKWENSDAQMSFLRSCDLILQMPTYINEIEKILGKLGGIPCFESVGEYGFVESEWFHPRSSGYSLGLHFLEMGIFIREEKPLSVFDLENKVLLEWLFEGCLDAESYRKNRRFFLSYLFSSDSIFVYLHALLKSLENDAKDIDVCMPDSARLIEYFDKNGQNPIAKRYHVRRICLQIGSHTASIDLEPAGKTLRILCPDRLGSNDFQRLAAFSENFVGCRGDQSLSEAVSINKCFFFDPLAHSRYFVKDLIALAENRIASHPAALGILRLFAKLLEHHLPKEDGEWLDEFSIQRQKPTDLLEIAEEMGQYLQNPEAFLGFRKLNRILIEEHSCNEFLLHLVQRAICHRRQPAVKEIESQEMDLFVHGKQSFAVTIERIRSRIQ